jgi:hypothetical protein
MVRIWNDIAAQFKYFLAASSAVQRLRYDANALIINGNIVARYMHYRQQVVKTQNYEVKL